jgi:hypothetical protein
LAFHHFDYLWETPMQSAAHEEQDLTESMATPPDQDEDTFAALAEHLDSLQAAEDQDLRDWLEGQADSD